MTKKKKKREKKYKIQSLPFRSLQSSKEDKCTNYSETTGVSRNKRAGLPSMGHLLWEASALLIRLRTRKPGQVLRKSAMDPSWKTDLQGKKG